MIRHAGTWPVSVGRFSGDHQWPVLGDRRGLQRVTLPRVTAGGVTLDHLEGFLSDAPMDGYPSGIDGVLGVRVLASKRASFDFERNRFAFAQ